jgi:hypothetical protein
MWGRLSPIVLEKFNQESCGVRPGIIRMHYQLAIAFRGIRCTSLRQWREYLHDIIHRVEFASLFESFDSMETARIPNHRQHDFSRLGHMTLPFRTFFFLWQPNEFVVRRQVKPRLVRYDDVTPDSVVLYFQHWQ